MKFSVIYADCPWPYDDKRTSKSAGMVLSAYPTMSISDLCALDVKSVAEDDCALCLWATGPKMREAFQVMDAWGFKYLTVLFVWVKLNRKADPTDDQYASFTRNDIYSGMGHYTNSNAEYVLLGRRGHPERGAMDIKQIVMAPVGAHSVKPSLVRTRIERLFAEGPYLELFGRTQNEGWTTIGNDLDGLDIRDSIKALAEREAR